MRTAMEMVALGAAIGALAFAAGWYLARRRAPAPATEPATPPHPEHAELAALHETTLGLINHLDVDDLLQLLVTRASALLGTDHGYLYVVDPAGDRIVVRVGTGLFLNYIGYGLRRGEGLAGRAWANDEALSIESYVEWKGRQKDLDKLALRALASVPIRAGTEFVGVLGLAYVEPERTFGPAEIALLQRFADMASLVLENARLYGAAQQELVERRRTEQALRAAEGELRAGKELAEALARESSEFLHHLSHEIRTPITSVIGMAYLLDDTGLNSQQREFVEIIRTGGQTLSALIDNFLDLAKIEVARPELASDPFDPASAIEEAIELVAMGAATKRLDLAYTIDPELPALLRGDWPRLRQIAVNLLSNAIKYTDAGGVLLSIEGRALESDSYELHYAVADTGIGIAPEHMADVFVPFRQLPGAGKRRAGGTGLGLAISRRLSGLMGGRMWIESTPGAGSTFHFTAVVSTSPAAYLPLEPMLSTGTRLLLVGSHAQTNAAIAAYAAAAGMPFEAAAGAREAEARLAAGAAFDIAILDARSDLEASIELAASLRSARAHLPVVFLAWLGQDVEQAGTLAQSAVVRVPLRLSQLGRALATFATLPAPAGDQGAPMRLLIVEDDQANQRLGLWLVEKLGHQADAAGTAAEALQALDRAHYDMVLLDMQLPDMDGIDVARAIRRRGDAPTLIAVSAASSGARRAWRGEVDDCLGKPLQLDELRKAIARQSSRAPADPPARRGDPLSESAAVDLNVLAKIRSLIHGQNSEGLRELVALYHDDAAAGVEQMRRALAERDADMLRRAAHKLKASSALLGAPQLARLCGQLELAAATLPPSDWPSLVDQIAAELDSVQAALDVERLEA